MILYLVDVGSNGLVVDNVLGHSVLVDTHGGEDVEGLWVNL